MQTYYEEIVDIGNNTFVVKASDVEIGEMVHVEKEDGTSLYGSVYSFDGENVTVQAMGPTRGMNKYSKVTFLKSALKTVIGNGVLGRVINSKGEPIDDGAQLDGLRVDVGTPTINPTLRLIPSKMIHTGIPMIDIFNSLVVGQKLPIFTISGQAYDELLMRIAEHTDADIVAIGLMGATLETLTAFMNHAKDTGALNKSFIVAHLATDYPVECMMVPDVVLTIAEQFAQSGKKVLTLLTDMTAFADSLKEVSIGMEMIPSSRSMPGDLYSQLAVRYEKAVDFESSGSNTILAVTTMPGNDITHPTPDLTGYITEGQLYLTDGRIDPLQSLSRLKQQVVGSVTRDDHNDIMNTMIRFYSDYLKSKELQAMGFKLSKWDEKLLKFGTLFETRLMDLSVAMPLNDALDCCWEILKACFESNEIGLKEELVEKYWTRSE